MSTEEQALTWFCYFDNQKTMFGMIKKPTNSYSGRLTYCYDRMALSECIAL